MQRQNELTTQSTLLNEKGRLNQVGWSRKQILDCNLENVNFFAIKTLQKYRVKVWDYYAVFTPNGFLGLTLSNLGYAGMMQVYTVDFETNEYYEMSEIVPFGKNAILARNSTDGVSSFSNDKLSIKFEKVDGARMLDVHWNEFKDGKDLDVHLELTEEDYESMVITIPIGEKRFYYNTKTNCMPTKGTIQLGDVIEIVKAEESMAQLDWGRGIWVYSSFWNWASTSQYLPDGRRFGLNLGEGFGNTEAATEDCVILDNKVHKLGKVHWEYDSSNYMKPWRFYDDEGRLDITLTPFKERHAASHLVVIDSVVHQMFGYYSGKVVLDDGEVLEIRDVLGFAEEHSARW